MYVMPGARPDANRASLRDCAPYSVAPHHGFKSSLFVARKRTWPLGVDLPVSWFGPGHSAKDHLLWSLRSLFGRAA